MKKGQRVAKASPSPKGKKTKRATKTKASRKSLPLAAAVKSFMGHLEGTGKASHTLDSYRFDLLSFGDFLQTGRGKPTLELVGLSMKDLEAFHHWLKAEGQKTNTRRRKLMTVRKFMHYLAARGKMDSDIARRMPAPEKIERVPGTIPVDEFRQEMVRLPRESHAQLRNLALLGLLVDTGCGVSEAAALRWSMLDLDAGKVTFEGKAERTLELHSATCDALKRLRSFFDSDDAGICFVGFNRHGPIRLGKKAIGITPRGIELVVKALAETLGFSKVTPRTLRHSAVVAWYSNGISEAEIQKRLGLKTAYAFRIYAPIFARIKSSSEATSIS
jgi:integrase/recombinase XerC